MGKSSDSTNKRKFEADTLDIQAARLVPITSDHDDDDSSSTARRKPGNSNVSGETVRRIIERLKGI